MGGDPGACAGQRGGLRVGPAPTGGEREVLPAQHQASRPAARAAGLRHLWLRLPAHLARTWSEEVPLLPLPCHQQLAAARRQQSLLQPPVAGRCPGDHGLGERRRPAGRSRPGPRRAGPASGPDARHRPAAGTPPTPGARAGGRRRGDQPAGRRLPGRPGYPRGTARPRAETPRPTPADPGPARHSGRAARRPAGLPQARREPGELPVASARERAHRVGPRPATRPASRRQGSPHRCPPDHDQALDPGQPNRLRPELPIAL